MARPTAFTRQTSFTQFSSNYPSKPQNGASLDAEFNAAKVALDETQANLALIQDDDGALARGSVGRAQLDSSITLGFESPETWQPATAYTVDLSTVFREAKFYRATETHISTDTFDLNKWELIADLSASAAIDDGSITDAKLADGAAVSAKIGALAVTTPKIASGAVTNSKMADGAVTATKIDGGSAAAIAALILPAGLGPIPWCGTTAPAGWVLDGGTYNRVDYPNLAAFALAEAAAGNGWFGTGDGSTTFTIKSGQGRVLAGADAGGSTFGSVLAVGGEGGANSRSIAKANLPNVSPTFTGTSGGVTVQTVRSDLVFGTVAAASGGDAGAIGVVTAASRENNAASSTGTFTPAGTISALGSGTALLMTQLSVGVRYIFKAH